MSDDGLVTVQVEGNASHTVKEVMDYAYAHDLPVEILLRVHPDVVSGLYGDAAK